jgi:heme A synthase
MQSAEETEAQVSCLGASMTTAVILLALLFWIAVCWVQYRYTVRRRQAAKSARRSPR